MVGLSHRSDVRPDRLSGGEQQRVAIAVALANDPPLLLADEPTGELDSQTASEVFGVLRGLNEELGVTVVVVTHDPAIANQIDRVVAIRDGRISTESFRRVSFQGHEAYVYHDEYAVVDRTGRLQIPKEYLDRADIHERARLKLNEGMVEVLPERRPVGRGRMTAGRTAPLVRVEDVSRSFEVGGQTINALKDVSFEVNPGEFVAVIGRSGSGKTTLLNVIAGLDKPTSGHVYIERPGRLDA